MPFTLQEMEKEHRIKECQEIIKLFDVSPTRVPYTYHHDYVRIKSDIDLSRADVAKLKRDEVECYILTVCHLFENQFDPLKVLDFSEHQRKMAKGILKEGECIINKTKQQIGEIYGEYATTS